MTRWSDGRFPSYVEGPALSKPNPLESVAGKRNLWCVEYGACLDIAIRENWSGFSCERCNHREEYVLPPLAQLQIEADALYQLIALIDAPDPAERLAKKFKGRKIKVELGFPWQRRGTD